jgi:hypothetical protein
LDERYWITMIPDEYKPKDYQLIEGGCYWWYVGVYVFLVICNEKNCRRNTNF